MDLNQVCSAGDTHTTAIYNEKQQISNIMPETLLTLESEDEVNKHSNDNVPTALDGVEERGGNINVGAWGYVIVFSVLLMQVLYSGWLQLQSFFFVEWQKDFQTSSLQASWLTSVGILTLGLMSPVAGVLASVFGSRLVVMCGGMIVFIGMIGTVFAQSIVAIAITWGLIPGVGFALVYSPSVATISLYFEANFATVTGVVYVGAALGQIIVPLVADSLIGAFGWRGACWVLSAIMLHLVLCGMMLRRKPLVRHNNRTGERDNPGFVINEEHEPEMIEESKRHAADHKSDAYVVRGKHDDTGFDNIEGASNSKTRERFRIRAGTSACKNLIRNVRFMLIMIIFFILGLLFFAPIAHSLPRALRAGISQSKAAYLPTIFGVGSLFGRVGPTFLIDTFQVPVDVMSICCTALCSVLNLLSPILISYWQQVTYYFVYGFGIGASSVLVFILVQKIVAIDEVAVALGWSTLALSLGDVIGSVFAGLLVDATDGYELAFYLLGVIGIIGTVLLTIVAYITRRATVGKKGDKGIEPSDK